MFLQDLGLAQKNLFKPIVIGSLYLTISSTGYFLLGDCLEYNVLDSLSEGPIKATAEALLLIHLIVAFPLIINAPHQYAEKFFGIPDGKFI